MRRMLVRVLGGYVVVRRVEGVGGGSKGVWREARVGGNGVFKGGICERDVYGITHWISMEMCITDAPNEDEMQAIENNKRSRKSIWDSSHAA